MALQNTFLYALIIVTALQLHGTIFCMRSFLIQDPPCKGLFKNPLRSYKAQDIPPNKEVKAHLAQRQQAAMTMVELAKARVYHNHRHSKKAFSEQRVVHLS